MENIKLPQVDSDYSEAMNDLFELFLDDVITEKKDGSNTHYTTDITALSLFIESIEDYSISEYLDEVLGDDSAESLRDFAVSLPELEIRQIINSVVEFATANDVDVNQIYDYIDLFVVTVLKDYVRDFSIRAYIDELYDLTLGEIIYNMGAYPDGSLEDCIEELKKTIGDAIDMVYPLTIDQIYNLVMHEDKDYIDPDTGKVFSITSNLKDVIKDLDDVYYLEYTLDKNGEFVDASVTAKEYVVALSYDDGVYSFTYSEDGDERMSGFFGSEVDGKSTEYTAGLIIDGDEIIDYSMVIKDKVVQSIYLKLGAEVTHYENGIVTSSGYETILILEYKEGGATDTLTIEGQDVSIEANITKKGDKYKIDAVITPDEGDEVTIHWEFAASIDEEYNINLDISMNFEQENGMRFNMAYTIEDSMITYYLVEFYELVEEYDADKGGYVKVERRVMFMEFEVDGKDVSFTYDGGYDRGYELITIVGTETKKGYKITAKGLEDEDDVLFDIELEFEETDDGVKLSFDVAKMLMSENYIWDYDYDNWEYIEYYVYNFIEASGGITISVK